MKVNVGTIDVDARDRYVIAKYFGDGRQRATRKQVRAFARGAVRTAVRHHADALTGRARGAARRLADAETTAAADQPLAEPKERQLNLLDGAK